MTNPILSRFLGNEVNQYYYNDGNDTY